MDAKETLHIQKTSLPFIQYLHTMLVFLLIPVLVLRFIWRARPYKQQHRYKELLAGSGPSICKTSPCFWLHAVSLGECQAACHLLEKLKKQYPDWIFIVSTTTFTSHQLWKEKLSSISEHVYFPLDFPVIWKIFLKKYQPKILILMESELWPNLLDSLEKQNIPCIVANARLSTQSTEKYKRIPKLIKKMLLQCHLILVQNKHDAKRYIQLGAKTHQIKYTGNIKCEALPYEEIQQHRRKALILKEKWGADRYYWVAASTHEDEEKLMLKVQQHCQTLFPKLTLILVPRHPQRFNAVFQLCKKNSNAPIQWSKKQSINSDTNVILADSLGELMLWYALADFVFVGGSLSKDGGHNPIEPSQFSAPFVHGPHTYNFETLYQGLNNQNATITVNNIKELSATLSHAINHPSKMHDVGKRAHRYINEQIGGMRRTYAHIDKVVKELCL